MGKQLNRITKVTVNPDDKQKARIVYWLKNSELSIWHIAKNLSIDESAVRAIARENGIHNRTVVASSHGDERDYGCCLGYDRYRCCH